MEENERLENTEELESNEAQPIESNDAIEQDESTETPPEETTELSALTSEIRDSSEDNDEPEEDDDDEDDEPASDSNKIRFGACLAAIGVFLFALAALIPSFWNTQLSITAIKGIAYDAMHRYDSANTAYGELYMQDQAAAEWSAENFSFGSSDAPVLTIGNFAVQRFAYLISKTENPYAAQQTLANYLPANVRTPRYLKPTIAKAEAQLKVYERIDSVLDPAINEATAKEDVAAFVLEGVLAARKDDPDAAAHAVFYDAINLDQTALLDPASEETGKLLAALKKKPDSEPWMYHQIEVERAKKLGDFKPLAALFAKAYARNRDDLLSLVGQGKALHLSGDKEKAQKLIKQYNRGDSANYMQALQAELLIRDGKYEEAIKLCDEVLKTAVIPESQDEAQSPPCLGAMEAVAQKGIALLLQGESLQALNVLRSTLDAPYGIPGTNYLGTILAATILAEDAEYMQWLLEQLGEYEIPAGITKLQEKTITIEEIYTDGWGGF